jgi:uncharacterized membrane protein HdeD (DUF308 family)
MRIFFRPSPQNALIQGILTIAIGVLILSMPGLTLKSVVMTVGAMILLSGVISLLFSYRKKGGTVSSAFQGFFNIFLGCLFLLSPLAIVKFFCFFFGLIFTGIGFMQVFGALGTLSKSFWSWIFLVFGVLMASGGIFLLVHPIESAENILTFFGAILLMYGVLELITAWRLRKIPPRSDAGNIVDTTYEEM